MANNSSSSSSSGIGFFGLLTVALIVLKLMGYINWSWWLVLLPLYGPMAIVLLIFAVVAVIALKN